MLDKKNRKSLEHMLEAAVDIREIVGDAAFSEFQHSLPIHLSVIKLFEIIGEAAGRTSEDFQEAHNHIPWAQIIGFRNLLVHTYDQVDLSIVWETLRTDLPRLIEQLEALLAAK